MPFVSQKIPFFSHRFLSMFVFFVVLLSLGYLGISVWLRLVPGDSGLAEVLSVETIESGVNAGTSNSIAVNSAGRPIVAFWDDTNDDLIFAERVGGGNGDCTDTDWDCTTVDAGGIVGAYASLAVNNSGNPIIAYHDGTNQALKYAVYVGAGGNCTSALWNCEVVDNPADFVGYQASIAVNGSGVPVISHYNFSNDSLKYAVYTGTGTENTCGGGNANWICETVAASGTVSAIGLNASNTTLIAFKDPADESLSVATYVGGGGNCTNANWNCTVVDSSATTTLGDMERDASNNPVIVYTSGVSNVKVAEYVGSSGNCTSAAWNCAVIENGIGLDRKTAITLNTVNRFIAIVAYKTGTTAIRLAQKIGSGGNCGSGLWFCETIDTVTMTGGNTSIAALSSGPFVISYRNSGGSSLKYAQANYYATTTSLPPSVSTVPPPVAPTDVIITLNENQQPVLIWKEINSALLSRTEILRNFHPIEAVVSGDAYASVLPGVLTFTDSSVVAGNTYRYIVRTVNTYQSVANSQEVSISIPALSEGPRLQPKVIVFLPETPVSPPPDVVVSEPAPTPEEQVSPMPQPEVPEVIVTPEIPPEEPAAPPQEEAVVPPAPVLEPMTEPVSEETQPLLVGSEAAHFQGSLSFDEQKFSYVVDGLENNRAWFEIPNAESLIQDLSSRYRTEPLSEEVEIGVSSEQEYVEERKVLPQEFPIVPYDGDSLANIIVKLNQKATGFYLENGVLKDSTLESFSKQEITPKEYQFLVQRQWNREARALLLQKLNVFFNNVRNNNGSVERVFSSLSKDELDTLRLLAQSNTSREMPDLNTWISLNLPQGKTFPSGVCEALIALGAEYCRYVNVPRQGVFSVLEQKKTREDFSDLQGYLDSAPRGLGIRQAWQYRGGKGENVKIIDLEGGWNLWHEDLPQVFFSLGNSQDSVFQEHGTAVLGEMCALDDEIGVVGIAPKAACGTVSFTQLGTEDALGQAVAKLSAGDVLLVNLQGTGPSSGQTCVCNCGQFEQIPLEYWQVNYDVIEIAQGLGITVVEAAGNGSMSLSDARYEKRFSPEVRDSGAIIVSAADSESRAPHCWANYGERVNSFAWGDSVVTTGYGDLASGEGKNQSYTESFQGTSSAAPMVAAAAAILQSIAYEELGRYLEPREVREVLYKTGTPQKASSHVIGTMPDVARAVDFLLHGPSAESLSVPQASPTASSSFRWLLWFIILILVIVFSYLRHKAKKNSTNFPF